MRTLLAILVVASTACKTAPAAPTTTVGTADIPPELAGHEIAVVPVGERDLLLAIADSPSLRAQGLMGVTDLGELDGMLFYWRHEAFETFWMKDTLIPLDIVWFNEDGTFAARESMEPCPAEPCPSYAPDGAPDFRYAIEAPPGTLDWIGPGTVISYSD